jgi:hypothetical protein
VVRRQTHFDQTYMLFLARWARPLVEGALFAGTHRLRTYRRKRFRGLATISGRWAERSSVTCMKPLSKKEKHRADPRRANR